MSLRQICRLLLFLACAIPLLWWWSRSAQRQPELGLPASAARP
jgi:hypothetical protein